VKGRKDENETESKVGLIKPVVAGLHLTKHGVIEAANRIAKMARVRGEGPFAAATINRRLSVLKGAAKWAWRKKQWTAENLSPYVILIDKNKETVRRRHIPPKDIERLIRHGRNFQAKAFMALSAYALMRQGEIMRTTSENIGRGLTLPVTKGDVPRVVPIIPQLRPFLKAIPFKHHKRTLYGWFEEARDKAGITDLTQHDLRRSGATILLNEGIPLEVVAHVLGDSLDVARRHYAHVLNRTAEKAMRKGFRPIKIPSGRARKAA
jgi:integrase